MARLGQALLTIAIPTYNRSAFLDRNLQYLHLQKDDLKDVELIVSDNSSTDDTAGIVSKYQALGLNINYIKNVENKGGDFNIAQCYIRASGKYVLTLGDDDVLVENSVKKITELLMGDFGVVFLNPTEFKGVNQPHNGDLEIIAYKAPLDFIKKVNFFVTFISGNIVNKKYLDENVMQAHQGTFLIQVPFILNAIMQAPVNVFVKSKLLLFEPDNTGGYNLFKIFGENFDLVISQLQGATAPQIKSIKKIVLNDILCKFFPPLIIKLKLNKNHNFINTNPIQSLKPVFKGYVNFWICCYPLLILPGKLAVFYNYPLRVYTKIRSVLR